jgi:hypothetical protein
LKTKSGSTRFASRCTCCYSVVGSLGAAWLVYGLLSGNVALRAGDGAHKLIGTSASEGAGSSVLAGPDIYVVLGGGGW